jgi:hypothetical protein
MTDLRQAAQQALDALETYKGFIDDAHIIEGQWHWLDGSDNAITALRTSLEQPQQEQMRMPKAGDKVICLEDESIGTIVSLTAGGSPDITFDDGSRGTYMVNEFAELFGYVTPPTEQPEQEPVETYIHHYRSQSHPNDFGIPKGHWWQAKQYADAVNTTPPQRPWVGLTDEDVNRESAPITSQMKLAFHAGMYVAQQILKERNT